MMFTLEYIICKCTSIQFYFHACNVHVPVCNQKYIDVGVKDPDLVELAI